MLRRLGLLSALAGSAALLGGCVSIQSITSQQQDIVGKLRLTIAVCASGLDDGDDPDPENEDHPGCFDRGNSDVQAVAGLTPQLLLGLRVPTGTGVPATISAAPMPVPPAAGTIVLRRNASYEAALQRAVPAPAGSMWIGYLSDTYEFDDGVDDVPAQSAQVSVDLTLPPTADGGPFVGPLPVRPVVGARLVVDPGAPSDRPVDCGPSVFEETSDTICIDSPLGVLPATGFDFQTRDFGIVAGNATASPGQTVRLPFSARGAGALPAGLTAALSASTNLPGVGGVSPSVPSVALANGSDARVTVPVAIPRSAGPGVFDVTVTGRLDNGQTRTGVAKLRVRDRQKPVISKLGVRPRAFRPATRKKPKRGANVAYSLSELARVRVVVERCTKYAAVKRGKKRARPTQAAKRRGAVERAAARGRCVRFAAMRGAQVKAGHAGANSFRFTGKVLGKPLKAGSYRLALTATDPAANVGLPVRVPFTIRR